MTDRTPAQIIGRDALLQLIFEGYAVVPCEPTEAMMRAAHKTWFRGTDEDWRGSHSSPGSVRPHFADTYRATIRAAVGEPADKQEG